MSTTLDEPTTLNDLTTRLYALLPALYRQQDEEQGHILRELIGVIAENTAAVQEGLDQAYDDLFIESCAPWVIPYIGELIGVRPRRPAPTAPGQAGDSRQLLRRAEVANTIGLRRRKGTLAVIEELARDVTGFPAVAVEFFQRLATTQHLNHLRPEAPATVSVRDRVANAHLDGPFDRAAHTLEVRRITSDRGRYNVPNIGIFLFRLQSYVLTEATAARLDASRYLLNPLGIDTPLYNAPEPEVTLTQFAGPDNVPVPLLPVAVQRLLAHLPPPAQRDPALLRDLARFCGTNGALLLRVGNSDLTVDDIAICDLRDDPAGSGTWARGPGSRHRLDPARGRLILKQGVTNEAVLSTFHYGFSAKLGGGSYERGSSIVGAATSTITTLPGNPPPDVQASLSALAGAGIAQFDDSRTHTLASAVPNLTVSANSTVEIRAANGQRPLLIISGGELVVQTVPTATLVLNGLVIAGGTLRIVGQASEVRLVHCTLVPGLTRTSDNRPAQPDAPSLVIADDVTSVSIEQCIVGGLRVALGANVAISASIVDATDATHVAFAGLAAGQAGGTLTVRDSTIIGRVHAQTLTEATNTIFQAAVPIGAPAGTLPVRTERIQQEGCVRYSYVPGGSRVPRRFHCYDEGARLAFTSPRFGTPAYCQLSAATDAALRQGADDEGEIGVFHDLLQPLREADLRTRLDEYLRFGLDAGIIYAS